ncbi:MAG: RyR domain-containing protein [Hyphomonas sp.]|jgi:hypothetical protein
MPLPADRLDAIARTVHEALRGWAAAHGQHDIPGWDDAPEWMHASTRESVLHALENGGADGRSQHEQWLAQKRADGWRHGPVKDAAAKTHPLMIPWDQLPDWERRKDTLINALARALA